MSKDFNIDEVKYESFDESEIKRFEDLGISKEKSLEERKISVKRKLAIDNLNEIRENVEESIDKDEFIELNFKATVTGLQYLLTTFYSAEYYFLPIAFRDVGLSYVVYATNKKIFIFETRGYNRVQRSYEIKYEDIRKFYYKEKKDRTILCFKAKKDKKGNLRECSSWIFYMYYTGRVNMALTCEDRDIITKFLDKRINKKV